MAIRTKDELIASYNALIGDRADDASIEMLEDISDTFADLEAASKTDWEQKYRMLDETWRERYRKRFVSDSGDDVEAVDSVRSNSTPADPDETPEKVKFEDLFDTK